MPIRLPIALLASAALLSCASDSFTAIDDAETLAATGWHEVAGGSVQLRSCGRAKQSYALMGDLEETLAIVADVLPAVPTEDPAPFYLFVLCAGEAYDALAPLPRQGNHFVMGLRSRARAEERYEGLFAAVDSSARGTRMVVREGQLRQASDLVRHHFVHHLIRSHADVPLWIEEGLAAFLGTLRREGDEVRRGRAPHAMEDLELAPLRVELSRVFRATNPGRWPIDQRVFFFRNSWLFTHYLHFGKPSKEAPLGERLRRFVESRAEGADEHEAARVAFGRGPVGLRTALDRYRRTQPVLLRRGRKVPVLRMREDLQGGRRDVEPLAIRPLATEEIALSFGNLAVENRRGPEAERWFELALRRDPGSARAQAGRGRALAMQGKWIPARDALASARVLDPDDPRVLLDAAWAHVEEMQMGSREARARARSSAERVLAERPGQAEAHHVLGLTLEEPADRLAALERAHAAAPGAIELALELAEARVQAGRVEEGRMLADRVAGWVLGETRYWRVKEFLDGLPAGEAVASNAAP